MDEEMENVNVRKNKSKLAKVSESDKLNSQGFLSSDIYTSVDFTEVDETVDSVSDEELDYDDLDLDEQLHGSGFNDYEVTEVDSVVNFRGPPLTETQRSEEMIKASDLESYVNRIVESKWQEKEQELLKKHGLDKDRKKPGKGNDCLEIARASTTPVQTKQKGGSDLVKSPLDTTLYAPALQRNQDQNFVAANLGRPGVAEMTALVPVNDGITDQISNFVETMRLEDKARREGEDRECEGQQSGKEILDPQCSEAAQIILDAERFKEDVIPPKGNNQVLPFGLECRPSNAYAGIERANRGIIDDDEFLYITCHVERSLSEKIE